MGRTGDSQRRAGRAPPERIRVLDMELDDPVRDIGGLDGYTAVRALVRLRGAPVAILRIDVHEGVCRAEDIRLALDANVAAATVPTDSVAEPASLPRLTVAVCTRDRADDLAKCLDALLQLDYPDLDIVVVDNAPSDRATEALCHSLPRVRHVVEPRPGLNWARNRALIESTSEILALTDDDARVDGDWARRIVAPFLADPRTMVVAGLVIPIELETPAQIQFEEYGGLFGGLRPIHFQAQPNWGQRGLWHCMLMAQHGSGANVAFRRSVFDDVGPFDPALDVGTATGGGGDTELIFRVLAHGHGMTYEPRAIVRHSHRREFKQLRRQVAGWGSGMSAVLVRSMLARPRGAWVLGLFAARGLLHQAGRLISPGRVHRSLILRELRGVAEGPWRYLIATRRANAIARRFGPQ
jgi:O-antigen biosynthesis protein